MGIIIIVTIFFLAITLFLLLQLLLFCYYCLGTTRQKLIFEKTLKIRQHRVGREKYISLITKLLTNSWWLLRKMLLKIIFTKKLSIVLCAQP